MEGERREVVGSERRRGKEKEGGMEGRRGRKRERGT